MRSTDAARAPRRGKIVLLAVAVLATVALAAAYADRHVLVSPQGRQCLRAAASLQETGALDVAPGRPFAYFPPLYPALLAGLAAAGLPPGAAVAAVNAVALVGGLLLFAAAARRMAGRTWIAATILFASLATHPYLFRMARPDALVAGASLLAILAGSRYADAHRRRDLLVAALACAVATTARYMAAFALLPIGGWILLRASCRPGRGRALDVAGFVAVAAGPLALWLLRNRARTGYLTGMSRTAWREAAESTDLGTNVAGTLKSVALDLGGVRAMGVRDLVYDVAALPHPAATWIVVGIVVLAGAAAAALAARRPRAAEPRTEPPDAARLARLVAAWSAAYVVAMIAVWTWANNDPIHTRYVAPLYGFGILLAARAAERARAVPGGRAVRALLAIAALAIAAVNVDKGRALWGESPSGALLRVRLHGDDLWVRGLEWDMFAPGSRPGPRP